MVELELDSYIQPIDLSEEIRKSFIKPIIFYMSNKNDFKNFFITFGIIDFMKNEIQLLFSYSEKNIKIIEKEPKNEIYKINTSPHCTISIKKDEEFITFMEDEEYFVHVNYKKMIMKIYTMQDLIKDTDIIFKTIGSTFYKDECDPEYFFMSAVDTNSILHIFRVSLDLKHVEEIDAFSSHPSPPHVLRRHGDYLFVSHEFKYSNYQLLNDKKIISQDELIKRIYLNLYRSTGQPMETEERDNIKQNVFRKKILDILKEKYSVQCLPGKILMINLETKEKTYYDTNGGSPAHFEVDGDFIYTSSHNFFSYFGRLFFLEPAVIDKFHLVNGKLELVKSFSYPKGFRYTSHKIFHYKEKTYICVFAQPNRLLFIDAKTMELLYYHDIGIDLLTNPVDNSIYMMMNGAIELVAVEAAQDGEHIIFIGQGNVYIYNFVDRTIQKKINIRNFNIPENLEDHLTRTVHFNYLD